MPSKKATLSFRCIDLQDDREVDALQTMTAEAKEISFETFSRAVDWKPLARSMGYAIEKGEPGLRLENDRCTTFYSSRWNGERVYYMVHSAIEFVFRVQPEHKRIDPSNPWGGMACQDEDRLSERPRVRA